VGILACCDLTNHLDVETLKHYKNLRVDVIHKNVSLFSDKVIGGKAYSSVMVKQLVLETFV
jgi:hypothetical protein